MAQYNSKGEEVREINLDLIEKHSVLTGNNDRRNQLYYQLKMSIASANKIDIIVSFIMESGVKMLIDDLKSAIKRGAKVRILTGRYLNITEPSALYKIKNELGNDIDIRMYENIKQSFHPKSYFFHYDNYDEVYIGSSNISRSALTNGIEWNYRFDSNNDKNSYLEFFETFEDLFNNHSIILNDKTLDDYSRNWHKPIISREFEKYTKEENIITYEPRGAQNEALYALNNTREEGADRALILAATGIGKTYLAAFDSEKYERVLFVAHREEILKQAATSFGNVRHTNDIGFFDGKNKDKNNSLIFASVNTLGNEKYLNENYFKPDDFDYIVIDEFHHAVNKQYMMIVNYFKPKFLLGLTATPDRSDGRNIYEICNYNVPFEISMREAINQGILVPFRYYGIYDNVDYSDLKVVNGRYSETELTELYKKNSERKDLILKNYLKYGSNRALGFCCSRKHAEEMAKYFNENGVASAAVYSNAYGEYSEERDIAIQKLVQTEIKVIFSVDMFNEGLDIPAIDMVMFLRPTESSIVFTQQLGRGLRTYPNKEYLKVLDFIGNYKKAGMIPMILNGHNVNSLQTINNPMTIDVPDGCVVDFDLKLIDLFKQIDEHDNGIKINYKKAVVDEYYRIKELVGTTPSRNDLLNYMDDVIYDKAKREIKIFKNYLAFKDEYDKVTIQEKQLMNSVGGQFLNLIATTDMTKVYKMAILTAFYNDGNIKMDLNENDLLKAWKIFFNKNANWKDLLPDSKYEDFLNLSDKWHLKKMIEMPIKFLLKSGKGFFVQREGYLISLNEEIRDYLNNPVFISEFNDIIIYRTNDYYRTRYHNRIDLH